MKKTDKIRLTGLLLTSFIVLAAPLLFFNALLTTALQRTEDSSAALLREKMLQEAERIKTQLTPAAYVKEAIRKIHSEVLPEVSRDLAKFKPDRDFGHNIFAASLPEKLFVALQKQGLAPWFITVLYPNTAAVYYWFATELQRQCPVPDDLANSIAYRLISVSSLYRQYYQREWAPSALKHNLHSLINLDFYKQAQLSTQYLNRFHPTLVQHDSVLECFTDYFGRQSSYYYAYNCLSQENLHGAYMIGILQSEIKLSEILKFAFAKDFVNSEANLVNLASSTSGFSESGDTLEYFERLPTEFINHFFFKQRLTKKRFDGNLDGYRIHLKAKVSDEVKKMRYIRQIFRITAGCLFLAYLMVAVHFWLFGFSLQISIRRKLLLILSVIIFIPVIGAGLLTLISLLGSDRVIENHVLEKTREAIIEFIQYENENDLRMQIAALEIKRRFEEYEGKNLNLSAMIRKKGENLSWLRSLMGGHTLLSENGLLTHFDNNMEILDGNARRLLNIIMPKFLSNLGILQKRENVFTETITLGFFEDYITAEVEENSIPHEAIVRKDISQTTDTSRAITVIARTKNSGFVFSYSRPADASAHAHAYLGNFVSSNGKWFSRSDPYCEIDIGARLRRHSRLEMSAWPANTTLNDEMLDSFKRAVDLKDSGQRIFHKENEVKASAWSYRPGRAAVFAAIGQSLGRGTGFFTISMLFPFLSGYAILLIMVLSLLFAEFIAKPVSIFSEGISRLNNEQYGVYIEKFSGDEFSLMTSAFNKMSAALRQREMIKRLVSKELIEKVETSNSAPEKTDKQHVSLLTSDIRGFTVISEKHSPTEVIELLNTYFTAMEEAIIQNGGTIDKYIGDAIQAVFYERPDLAPVEKRACLAGLGMRQQLFKLNQQRAEKNLFALENGIGIASGEAVSGSIGSETGRKDFTIIGRITEHAATLEAATVHTNSKILVCSATHQTAAVAFNFRPHTKDGWELIDAG